MVIMVFTMAIYIGNVFDLPVTIIETFCGLSKMIHGPDNVLVCSQFCLDQLRGLVFLSELCSTTYGQPLSWFLLAKCELGWYIIHLVVQFIETLVSQWWECLVHC